MSWNDERVEAITIEPHARYLCYVVRRDSVVHYTLTVIDYEKASNGSPREHNAPKDVLPMQHSLRYTIDDRLKLVCGDRYPHDYAERQFWHYIHEREPDLWARLSYLGWRPR